MAATIFLIRHGQSTFNAHHEATGTDPGHIDARLTELGHQQVAAARAQAAALPRPDLVLSSPLTRALQTTLGIFGGSGVPVQVAADHREQLESFCDIGRAPAALAAEFPGLRFDHLDDPWWHSGPRDHRGLPVEPHAVFAGRVAGFTRFLADHPSAIIAVVGHGTFFRHLTGRGFANCEILPWSPPT
ncbi:MAG: histidine phosphatase family protein [Acetobacteraceae bacterium]|nr:histidine phosphatase family protein [Acetobacteraceae bacterium]